MVLRVHRLFKSLLFFSLFFFSARYIYPILLFMPAWHQYYSIIVSQAVGIHDLELFDMLLGVIVSLISSMVIYASAIGFYRYFRK